MPIKHTRHGNHLLAALPDEDFDRLAPHLTEQPFPKGYILQQRDEPLHLVYFPDSSLSGLICPTEDGSNTQVAMVGREGMVGVEAMFGSRVAMCDAVIHSTDEHLGHVMTIDAFHREMNRHGALYSVARQYTGALMVSLARWVACNASHSAEQRCCRWLLEATFRMGRYEVAVTHELLSDLLGLRRSTVTQILRRLHDHGIISTHRGLVRIDDQGELEQRSCECHRVSRELFSHDHASSEIGAGEELPTEALVGST